jgi:hypothetical protein
VTRPVTSVNSALLPAAHGGSDSASSEGPRLLRRECRQRPRSPRSARSSCRMGAAARLAETPVSELSSACVKENHQELPKVRMISHFQGQPVRACTLSTSPKHNISNIGHPPTRTHSHLPLAGCQSSK